LENNWYTRILRESRKIAFISDQTQKNDILVKQIISSKLKFIDKIWYLLPSKYTSKFVSKEKIIERSRIIDLMQDRTFKYFCEKYELDVLFKKIGFEFSNIKQLKQIVTMINDIVVSDQYLVKKHIKKDFTVIDAGANIGIFSIFASMFAGKVYAFEPETNNFEKLKKHILNLNLHNVSCLKLGLGSLDKTSLLCKNNVNTLSHSMIDSDFYLKSAKNTEEIKLTSLDNFVKEKNISSVDFIKIDVEGYELKVLLGAKSVISRFKPIIVVSAYHHPSHKKKIPKIITGFRKDYKFKRFNHGEEDYLFF